ncbi:hypothetical protein AMTRI_Chr01g112960 [Amborella trichopoda]
MDGGFGHLEKVEGQLPPGFRFHPTDEELITYYLRKKVLDGGFTARAIAEVDLNKCEPWELPEKAKMGEKEWYFFSLRDRKYPTGLRTNRATEAGYWKATGKDREIYCSRTCSLVGMKKTLVFYKGRAPKGEKSNWVMHEYRLDGKLSYHYLSRSTKDEWVVSRVFQKSNGGKKGRGSYTEAGSPSLPALLEERESCCSYESESGGGPPTRDHVSCFSTPVSHSNPIHQNQGQSQMHFSEVAAHYLHHSIAPPLLAEPPRFNRGGVAAFPSLRSLQENLHIPFFFGGESSGGNDAGLSSGSGGAMQWGVAEQKVVVAEAGQQHGGELDCMWTYRYD